ncbi:hypothetical protein BUALT_Bualt10G0119100 [Buddleja alternifolia]|uniref:Histidine-containing phosphotransfer protein n=1 Tax=Buddleja alternifolia TaxID=168488 RepID=A0AAV6WZG7_9LAMI|nr:hypothetical protein BUALT_Bualt10G0119100 [Buddleja alternifolia]
MGMGDWCLNFRAEKTLWISCPWHGRTSARHMPEASVFQIKIPPFLITSLFLVNRIYIMEGNQLQRQAAYLRNALFDQGYLDHEQFIQLEDLQDEANPNFVEEVVKLFYTDSARYIRNLDLTLDSRPIDFEKLDNIMHQFMGSSSRCMRTFQEVKHEHAALRKKLESYLQIARQAR